MLIECPKCGFSQPKDQYCANCGVDMHSFKPSRPPIFKRIFTHPGIILLLILSTTYLSYFFIKQQESASLKDRLEYVRGGLTLLEKSPEVVTLAEEASTYQEANFETSDSNPNLATEPTVDTRKTPPTAPTAAAVAKSAPPTESSSEKYIHFLFIESSSALAEQWERDSEGTGQALRFDDVFRGPLPNYKQKMGQAPGLKILHQSKIKIETNNTAQWHQTLKSGGDPDIDQSLIFFAYLYDTENPQLHRGEVEIQRNLRESATPPGLSRRSYVGAFEMPATAAYMFTNLLPRKIVMDESELFSLQGLFRIYNSRAFAGSMSQFTILMYFDTPSSNAPTN